MMYRHQPGMGRNGGCDLVIDGAARGHPATRIASETLPTGFGRLAAAVARARRPEESFADALAHLGAERVAALLGGSHG